METQHPLMETHNHLWKSFFSRKWVSINGKLVYLIFGYVDMKLNFNEEKKQQLGFIHLTVDVKIFSRNESIFDFSRLRTTIYN
jgi:hypothetical protein